MMAPAHIENVTIINETNNKINSKSFVIFIFRMPYVMPTPNESMLRVIASKSKSIIIVLTAF